MNDRELLELAAKAAGHPLLIDDTGYYIKASEHSNWRPWYPLADDGDALRLAVKLKMTLGVGVARADCGESSGFDEPCDYAATRRAIVRAAAEIGRAL